MTKEMLRPLELTQAECRIRAAFYRHLARSATTSETRDPLIQLAERYEGLAVGRGTFRYSNNYACEFCCSTQWEDRRDPLCACCGFPLVIPTNRRTPNDKIRR
jgi:hypothetical protein